jgi:hypothetical protein
MDFIQLDSFKEALQIIISLPSFQPILKLFNTSISKITTETDILNFLIKIYSSFNKFYTFEHLSIIFFGISCLLKKKYLNVNIEKEIKNTSRVLYCKHFFHYDIQKNIMEQNLIEDEKYFASYVEKMIYLFNCFDDVSNTTIVGKHQFQNADTLWFVEFFQSFTKALPLSDLYNLDIYKLECSTIKLIKEIPINQSIQKFILYPYVKNILVKKIKLPYRFDKPMPIEYKEHLYNSIYNFDTNKNKKDFWSLSGFLITNL